MTLLAQRQTCTAALTIDLNAIERNIAILKAKAPHTRLMAMVKANAYGTDAGELSIHLQSSIDIFGVANINEARHLRGCGITGQIFILHALPDEAEEICAHSCITAVSDLAMAQALSKEACAQGVSAPIHIHIDTGMTRLGCKVDQAKELAIAISTLPGITLEGAMTHFPAADEPEHDVFTYNQVRQFLEACSAIERQGIALPWKHAANSSGLLRFEFPELNMARVGLALYGLHCSEACQQVPLDLAVTLQTTICGLHECEAGTSVSYGRNYRTSQDSRIGVLPVGYYDGIHRSYSGRGRVLVHGQYVPMVGNICMDFMMLDLSSVPEAAVGDLVTLFGSDSEGNVIRPEDFAACGSTIAHELITCLGPRIQRCFRRIP